MVAKSTHSRLDALTKQFSPDEPLTILAIRPDCTEPEEMTVDEMVSCGAGFCRVAGGDSLSDLDVILEQFRMKAKMYVETSEQGGRHEQI